MKNPGKENCPPLPNFSVDASSDDIINEFDDKRKLMQKIMKIRCLEDISNHQY
jgi:hypothetical protein